MKVVNRANVRAKVINLLGPLHFRVDVRVRFPVQLAFCMAIGLGALG